MENQKNKKPEWANNLPNEPLVLVKYWHILETLERCNGNRTHAAKCLEISLRGLRLYLVKLRAWGFEVPAPEKMNVTRPE